MYNRYIPGADGYTRIAAEEKPIQQKAKAHTAEETSGRHRGTCETEKTDPMRELFRNLTAPLHRLGGENKNAGMAGILKALHLEELDSGDLLLMLIILLLFLEGDNIELVITLGLMLLLSLRDEKKEDQNE